MVQNKNKHLQIGDLRIISLFIEEVQYQKNKNAYEDDGFLNIKDEISNFDIVENIVFVRMSRRILFKEEIYVKFKVEFECTHQISEQEFKEVILNSEAPFLSNVYRMISVVISNITAYSEYGPLVTIPTVDIENIKYE